jgi:hypothetical protein
MWMGELQWPKTRKFFQMKTIFFRCASYLSPSQLIDELSGRIEDKLNGLKPDELRVNYGLNVSPL